MKRKVIDDTTEVKRGSGNVYADLGFSNSVEMLAKARLVAQIQRVLTDRKLTQAAVAQMLGVDRSRISKLLRGHFHCYSRLRLTGFLSTLLSSSDSLLRC